MLWATTYIFLDNTLAPIITNKVCTIWMYILLYIIFEYIME